AALAADGDLSRLGAAGGPDGAGPAGALGCPALGMAGRRRNGAVDPGAAGRQRAFRHVAAGGLCAAAVRRRADCAAAYRAEAEPVMRGPSKGDGALRRIAAQSWMREPATRSVLDALGKAGIAARFVGGCVRDAILRREIADIDLATPARPEAVIAAL